MTAPKVCFNTICGATSSVNWRSGWILRSGQLADLCDSCGSAYEQMRFCETFHLDDAGWRMCKMCDKPVHCGCISSINLFMHLDAGGIECILCAEKSGEHISGYFSSKTQPEGVPLKIEDVNRKDWMFQCSIRPNNNRNLHVLEEVKPHMRPVQLQAGDTVNFSQLEPEERIITGFRKASNFNAQEGQLSEIGNGASPVRFCDPGPIENISANTDMSGILLHSRKRKADSTTEELISPFNDTDTDFRWYKNDQDGGKSKERHTFQSLLLGDKMQSHNLGTKNKRLQIDNEDALKLKVTWEEAQDLFSPPLTAVPSVVVIEGHEFEEYEEPPILGKRTTLCTKSSRAPSSASPERSFEDLEKLPDQSTGSKKKKGSHRDDLLSSSGLDASANAATLGKKMTTSSLVSPTTKHPRHRLGCTCIVCIQPPSGMGPKHKPSCNCIVCMTVKRRFKTLMMRRRKEAEYVREQFNTLKEQRDVSSGETKESDTHSHFESDLKQRDVSSSETKESDMHSHFESDLKQRDVNSSDAKESDTRDHFENEFIWENTLPAFKKGITKIHDYPQNGVNFSSHLNFHAFYEENVVVEEDYLVSKGQIDLNSQPVRDEEGLLEIDQARTGLLDDAALPLDMCVKQCELPTLIYPPQISDASGFQQSSSEGRVEQTSRVQNEDHIFKEEFNSNRTEKDAKSIFA